MINTLRRAESLKAEFDQLTDYKDRIKFCLENLHPGPCMNTAPGVATYLLRNTKDEDVRQSETYHPQTLEDGSVIISTMPQTPEEWQLNNKLFYKYSESTSFEERDGLFFSKSFIFRKEEFEKRVLNTVDADAILNEEIDVIFNEYERPGKKLDEMFIYFDLQIKSFRERRRGIILHFPAKQDKWFNNFEYLIKIIEADHAYRYYTYLRKLQHTPDWIQTLRAKSFKETRYFLDNEFIQSYNSQYLIDYIKKEGYFFIDSSGNQVKVFLGPLAAFLISEDAKVKNLKTRDIETVNGKQFLDCYVLEFKKGAEHFDRKYRVPPEVLFGPKAKEFGEVLHFQYFHSQGRLGGWNYWRRMTPRIITYEKIKEYGYYAGIVSRFEDMAYEYPDYFNKYVFPSCKTNGNMTNENNEELGRKVIAEIEIPGFDDPAKLQRGVTSLVQQLSIHRGQEDFYLHPFLWYTKIRHPNSSEYVLEVNKEGVDNQRDIKKKSLTDEEVDEAFIRFITSCHVNQIAPFLSFQFEKYYNRLKANESAQPFFDHIIKLVDTAISRGILYKAEMDALAGWIASNPHYSYNPIDSSDGNQTVSTASSDYYSSFSDLFFDKKDIDICVNALRKIEQPVIGEGLRWIGKKGSKSILVAWIDRLEYCNKIRLVSDRRQLVQLLNSYFPNLNFGAEGRQFGEKNAIYDRYKIEFASLILP